MFTLNCESDSRNEASALTWIVARRSQVIGRATVPWNGLECVSNKKLHSLSGELSAKKTDRYNMYNVNSLRVQGMSNRVSVSGSAPNDCQSFRTPRGKNAGLFLPGS